MARRRGSYASQLEALDPDSRRRRARQRRRAALRTGLAVMVPGLILVFFAVQILGTADGSAGPGDGSADRGPVTSPEQLTVPDRPGGGVPIGQVDIRVKEGRTNGQRAFASGFVEAAYAPAGSDEAEYREGVEEYVEPDSYYESEGGRVLDDLAGDGAEAPEAGNAAVLVEYEITSGPALNNTVTASEVRRFVRGGSLPPDALSGATLAELVYAAGERYDGSGIDGVSGEVRYYAQDLLLTEASGEESRWTVLAGSAPERVEDPNAGAPAHQAPKVGAPNGGGHEH